MRVPCIVILFLLPGAALSEEKSEEEESLDEELSTLEDADFPDLISADGQDELMEEFAFLEDAGVVESAARHRQVVGMSPSAITVITRQDIETSGATTIPDLLRLVPGMNVVISNPFFTCITTRLFYTDENNHMLVLIDGREINFDLLGFAPWEVVPISLEDISRIEIIRGPGSALYGANALAGVVSITTRKVPQKASARFRLEAGEAGRIITDLNLSTRLGDWGMRVSGASDFSGTFADPRESTKEVWKLRAYLEHRWSESKRFIVDLGFASGRGPLASPMGTVSSTFSPLTLRLAYESEKLDSQLFYSYSVSKAHILTPLDYSGIRLARFAPATIESHYADGYVQWEIPELWKPLLLIVGGGPKVTWMSSGHMLDAETFADPASSRYHLPGITHWEIRAGAFVHAELAPTDWVTVTGGSRVDYNTQTGFFVSPRIAAVFQPVAGQFLRVGVARSFRKPSPIETTSHLMVEFPEDSPITGTGRDLFQEFMTRVGGNNHLGNEELLAFEAGYLGEFLDDALAVGLDLYCNLYRNISMLEPNIVEDERGLPDLEQSSFMFGGDGPDINIFGGELHIRYAPVKNVSLIASWSHRQVVNVREGDPPSSNPINQITLGGRFKTRWGLLGSLYAFARSEFWHYGMENPAGLLEPRLDRHVGHTVLILSKLGWRFDPGDRLRAEVGLKLSLPISPFQDPLFGYYEGPGGIGPDGRNFGSALFGRMVTVYLQGSF